MDSKTTQPEPDDTATSGDPDRTGVSSRDATKISPCNGGRRVVLLTIAGGFFLLGVLGMVLPVLPTTPFLLLTSYFLVRSSPHLNARLLRSRFFGPILTDWQIRRGVRKDIKLKAVAMVVMTVGGSLYLTAASAPVAAAVAVLALIGIVVILRLPNVD